MVLGSKKLNVSSYIQEVIAMIHAKTVKVTGRTESKGGQKRHKLN